MCETVFIAVGSNLQDRWANLVAADRALCDSGILREITWSDVYETRPVGGPPGQGDYLNAVLRASTPRGPEEVLKNLQDIEHRLGRTDAGHWGPRVIDLDLLLYDGWVLETRDLILPHPRMHERRFVLVPLVNLSPEVRHPVLGWSARRLLESLPEDNSILRRLSRGVNPAAPRSPRPV